ncbi:hypothetical protein P154DRAFT_577918 [Amniculicola lignicola CBS 123094]|uniref:F-box domain-containing protein n=1 Tax=Amniculicola lignicola CBS 123094 TaxID=1392246 RepID=A0A6A5WLQ2_9PLEO|nr:hypothetical protein P154DRAFT_577918 [Amniculicola lignicola CBS 123094]
MVHGKDSVGDFQYLRPAEYSKGQIPRALQPRPALCHSEQELGDLQAWRREVAVFTDERIAAYETRPTFHTASGFGTIETGTVHPAGNRVVEITELIEQILRYVDPVTRLIALGVCKRWRDVALYIIKQVDCRENFSREPCCSPVRLHDMILDTFSLHRTSIGERNGMIDSDEMPFGWCKSLLDRKLLRLKDTAHPDIIPVAYHSGQFTQEPDLFIMTAQLLGNKTGWQHLPDAALECLSSGVLTHPPGVSLNISTRISQLAEHKPRPQKLLHIVNVKNEEGIQIGELVSALKKAYSLAMEHWVYWVKILRASIDKIPWDHDIWIVENAPKLFISIDPFTGKAGPAHSVDYLACIYALPPRDQRQAEWMPESMFKHDRRPWADYEQAADGVRFSGLSIRGSGSTNISY